MTEQTQPDISAELQARRAWATGKLRARHAQLWSVGPSGGSEASSHRHVVLQNIFDNNWRAESLVDDTIDDFKPGSPPDQQAHTVVGGVNNTGKSSIVQGLIQEGEGKFEQMYPAKNPEDPSTIPPERPRVVTHDFVDTLPAARHAGVLTTKLGFITDWEYRQQVAPVDNQIKELVLKFSPWPVWLIDEQPITETFDQNGASVGPPRGSIDWMRQAVLDGKNLKLIYAYTLAQQRLNSIGLREMVSSVAARVISGEIPATSLLEMLIRAGIDDDRIYDPFRTFKPDTIEERLKLIPQVNEKAITEIVDSYSRYNRASANQHTQAVVDAIVLLTLQGEIEPKIPEYRDREALSNLVVETPEVFTHMIKNYFAPRLEQGIFPSQSSNEGLKFDLWYNPPLDPRVRRPDRRRFFHQHSAFYVLGREAQIHRHDKSHQELVDAAIRFGFITP